jgi:hypothetical protein
LRKEETPIPPKPYPVFPLPALSEAEGCPLCFKVLIFGVEALLSSNEGEMTVCNWPRPIARDSIQFR